MKNTFLLLIAVLHGFWLEAQTTPQQLEKLNAYYEQALADWNVPGMAIAIVRADTVLFSRGYGVIDIHTAQPVDENTLFAVASNTKAFTATALAMCADEGLLKFSDQVQKHLPWFKLYDPYVSSQMTIADLLSHRSGLKTFSGDLIWYGSNYSREEVIRRAAFLKPAHGFRAQFGYSNIMYLTAGEIIPRVTGISWDDFVEQRILQPLGMHRSVLHVRDLAKRDNVAQPHTYVDGKLRVIPWLDWDNIGPAGSLISSAKEMGKWIQFQLRNGVQGNDTLVSPDLMHVLQSPFTINSVSQSSSRLFPTTHFKAYGLGWSLMDYRGRKIVSHNGGYDGMISQTLFIPEENIGFVILTNSLSSLYYPLMYKTLDVLLGASDDKDWSSQVLAMVRDGEAQAAIEVQKAEASRDKNTRPSHPMEAYTGMYNSPIYDSVEVRMEDGKLYLAMLHTPDFQGSLTHWQHNTYKLEFPAAPSLPAGFVTFFTNRGGKVDKMEIFIDNPDFDFTELELTK